MTSIAPRATPIAAPAGQIDPALVAAVQSLPADQQQRAMAELQSMTPQQQAQLLAQVSNKTTPQQAQAASSVTPVDQAANGAVGVAPPNKMKTILKSVGIFGAAGAALGFGASLVGLPFAAPVAAAIGGGIGVIAGIVKGLMDSKKEQLAYDAEVGAQAPPTAGAPAVEPPTGTQPAEEPPPPAGDPVEGAAAGGRTYTVRPGDNLSVIAARHDLSWRELYRANRDAVGSNPDLIHPGLRLRIPEA